MSSPMEPEVQCPGCGAMSAWFAEVCTSCGTSLAGTSLQDIGGLTDRVETDNETAAQTGCPNCSTLNGIDDRFCTSCGTPLVEPLPQETSLGIGQGDAGLRASTQKPCPNCSTLNEIVDRFCISCGTPFAGASPQGPVARTLQGDAGLRASPQKLCPNCSASNEIDDSFCISCGTPFSGIPSQDAVTFTESTCPVRPSNYLPWAILSTLCCCVPSGIVAIIYAAQVNSKWESGDQIGSEHASSRAKMWILIGVGISAACWILYAVYVIAIGVEFMDTINEWNEWIELLESA